MNLRDKTILVSGATGRQGGACARSLLKLGCQVRILTRDPGNPLARELIKMGATASKGSFDDPASLQQALQGCYGAFSVQDFYTAGLEGEVRQGKVFADAALDAGIQHFVYSSVGAADKNTGIPFFETKWQIEQYITSLDLSWTIVRPVFFMDNFSAPDMKTAILNGKLSLPLPPDRSLQMIAVCDIGAIAAQCFAKGSECFGQAYDIAGDELTMAQAVSQFSQVLGKTVRYEQAPIEPMRKSMPEVATMFQWFNDVGYSVNIDSVRRLNPKLLTFNNWIKQSQWATQEVGSSKR
jgi:uncharacterized protein YbjT (DUF2867 family)